ncbi:MAG: hypothetical protein AB7N65_06605 [Vicinamibacterales bacterium]
MKALRTGLIALLMTSITMPAFAGDLQTSVARAMDAQATPVPLSAGRSGSKPIVAAGAALFVTGFAVGAYSFLNNKNGSYSEFGEASARNVKLGSAGLTAAFAGGLLMFLGSRAKQAPTVSAAAGSVSVTKRLSW